MKNLITFCFLLIYMFDGGVPIFAQEPQQKISGVVIEQESNEKLQGVSVSVAGTNKVTVTNANGSFTINAQIGDELVFSYIGYKSARHKISSTSQIQISLQPDITGLDQVVVVGYGTKRKKDLTGAISVVNVEAMNKVASGSVTSQLQGMASGVTVIGSGRPGEQPQVRIRGFNTFGNNSPLFIVDGVPLESIGDLNPNDVASMQVLKDAGAASIYGSRAANGVIIISTKTGSDKTKISYDAYYGTQQPAKGNVWNLLSPLEMAELKWMAAPSKKGNDPQFGNGTSPRLPDFISPAGKMEGEVDFSLYKVDPNYTDPEDLNSFYRIVRANKTGTNWYEEIFNPAPITSHNLSVSGGTTTNKFLISFNYFNQEGTMMNTYNQRYTIRANSEFKIGKFLTIGENLSAALSKNPVGGTGAMQMAFRQQPIIPVHDIMGNYAGSFGPDLGNALNPVAILDRIRENKSSANRLFGSVFAEANPLKGLFVRSQFGGEIYSGYTHTFGYPEYENSANENTMNSYYESSSNGNNWTWTNTIRYQLPLNENHQVNVLVGTEAFKNTGRFLAGATESYFSFDPDYVTLSTGSGTQTNSSSRWGDALFSAFGKIDYSFKDTYLLAATIRRDGSSKFLTYQYGWFPAVSGAWRISKEKFFKSSWITDLKIRGSYGIMGNQMNVAADNAYTTFMGNRLSSYYDIGGTGNSVQLGIQRGRVGNPDAKWEKNINANVGFDALLFNGKLDLSVEYYRKDIRDLLYNPQLPGTSGTATSPYVNIAQMSNQGIDLSASSTFKITESFSLSTQLTFTTYKNKIEKISNDAQYFDQEGRRFSGASIVRNGIGTSIGQFYGYNIIGFWNSQAEIDEANSSAPGGLYQSGIGLGRFRYQDKNEDGRITAADRDFLGNPNPDFSYGINIGAKYKDFDFSMFLFGVAGNEVWNQLKWWHDFYPTFGGAKSKTALYNSWTPTRMDAKAPIQEVNATFSTSQVPNSYYVENGSYLRAKNTQLGYTLSHNGVKKYGIEKIRIYLQASNLFTITGYSGTDPEIPGGNTSFGIDEGIYPSQKQYLLGLNVTF